MIVHYYHVDCQARLQIKIMKYVFCWLIHWRYKHNLFPSSTIIKCTCSFHLQYSSLKLQLRLFWSKIIRLYGCKSSYFTVFYRINSVNYCHYGRTMSTRVWQQRHNHNKWKFTRQTECTIICQSRQENAFRSDHMHALRFQLTLLNCKIHRRVGLCCFIPIYLWSILS